MEADLYEYESKFGGGEEEEFCFGFPFDEDKNQDNYPTFPDAETAIKHFAIDKKDKKEEDLQSGALKEFCRNETELLSSKTASRIIKIAETEKLARDIQTLALEKPEKIATGPSLLSEALKIGKKPAKIECYNRFINGEPISKKERDYLITLFKNPEIRTIILETLSKINILYGIENKEFIKRFLENEKGEYDISNPLRCVLHNLENYPFVVDFSFDEIAPCKLEVNYPVGGQYYEYKKGNKLGFILKLDNKLYYLTTLFDKLDILSNGLVFGIVDLNKDGENNDENKIGEFYQFNGTGFDLAYGEKGIKYVYEFSNGLIRIKGDNEKYGMLRVNEIQKDILGEVLSDKGDINKTEHVDNGIKEFKIDKILDINYDKLQIKNGLIIAFNEDEDRGFGKLELFKNTQVNFTKIPFQIKDFTLKLLEIDDVTFHSHFKHLDIQFYEDGNFIDIQTLEGHNFFSYSDEKNNLTPIDGLQQVKIEQDQIEGRLFGGIPVLIIEDKGNTQYVVVFNKETRNVSKIIKGITKYIYLENQMQNLYTGFVILKSEDRTYIMYKNGAVYCLKPGFKIIHADGMSTFFVKKGFFSKKTFVSSREELKNHYADLVLPQDLPIIIN